VYFEMNCWALMALYSTITPQTDFAENYTEIAKILYSFGDI